MKKYEIQRYRDLTIIDIGIARLVVACDSAGAIGEKEHDQLFAPLEIVGGTALRVPLMEVLASGASVVSVIDTVSCEMEPSARRIIDGIYQELKLAGIDSATLNGSTEENFKTVMTAIGITVIGVEGENGLKFGNLRAGSKAFLFGRPLVGQEVLDRPGEMATYDGLKKLVSDGQVDEIVPVGSKGILYEAELLASLNGLSFIPNNVKDIDFKKTAGPASCLVAAVREGWKPFGDSIEIGCFE